MKRVVEKSIVALLILTVFATGTQAQEGLYFGGSVGPSFLNTKISDVNWDDVKVEGNDLSYKVYVGYMFPAFLALEGGYRNLGRISDAFSSGWDLNAKANLSIGPLQLFGKAGAFFNNVQVTFQDPLHPDINKHNTKFIFGFAATLNIERLGIRAEW
jgi:hypothetical protein